MADKSRFGGQSLLGHTARNLLFLLVGRVGLEPTTIGLKGRYVSLYNQAVSSQLSAIFKGFALANMRVFTPFADSSI